MIAAVAVSRSFPWTGSQPRAAVNSGYQVDEPMARRPRRSALPESVAELLSRLRFEGRSVETLYLNETRAREHFIGHLGAIESFTRSATREGSAEVPVVKLSGGISSESEVTWTLGDPISQVLILRAALESRNLLHGINDAGRERYIAFSGTGMVSRPDGRLDAHHRKLLEEYPGLYEALEAYRAERESILRLTAPDSKERVWLLTINQGDSVCASPLDGRWLRPGIGHWIGAQWEIFGLFRQFHETGVPLLAAIHVGLK